MSFEAAVGEVDITPENPPYPSLWMGGYGWGPRGNHGAIARRLRAQCLVLWDGGVPKILLRADLISIPRDVNQAIRGTLVAEGLVAANDLMLLASHTHSGPLYGDTKPSPQVMMGLSQADVDAVNGTTWLITDALVQLVRDTLDLERTAVTLSYAEGEAKIGHNRVADNFAVLDTVPVLRLDNTDGDLFAIVFGAACHPVSRGNDEVFDGEFPAVASALIENELGVPALFVQGACGDQEANDPHVPETTEQLGAVLGQAVLDVLGDDGFDTVTGPVNTAMTEVNLPFHTNTANPDVLAAVRARYKLRLKVLPQTDPNRSARRPDGEADRRGPAAHVDADADPTLAVRRPEHPGSRARAVVRLRRETARGLPRKPLGHGIRQRVRGLRRGQRHAALRRQPAPRLRGRVEPGRLHRRRDQQLLRLVRVAWSAEVLGHRGARHAAPLNGSSWTRA